MTDALASIVAALNGVANALGGVLAPIGHVPGWLSATVVAVLTGLGMLVAFKYTSNQRAIQRVRRGIRADLLAVKLFKDDVRVGLRAQARLFGGALRLLALALVPILAMTVPMVFLLAQLGVWYQTAPLPPGEETVVTVRLNGPADAPMPDVELIPPDGLDGIRDLSGPVRIESQREVCWAIHAVRPGYHRLKFRVGDEVVEKELAVGTDVMKVSPVRPGRDWYAMLLNPREKPFDRADVVQAIEVQYPARDSWTSGTDDWVVYWFVVSLLAGFCFRGALKVNL